MTRLKYTQPRVVAAGRPSVPVHLASRFGPFGCDRSPILEQAKFDESKEGLRQAGSLAFNRSSDSTR